MQREVLAYFTVICLYLSAGTEKDHECVYCYSLNCVFVNTIESKPAECKVRLLITMYQRFLGRVNRK